MKTKETQKTPYDNLDEKEARTFLKVLDSLPGLKIGIPDVRWWIEQLNKKS